jgi:hypothetical protein
MRTKPLYYLRTPDQALLMRQKKSAAARLSFSRRLARSIDRAITACQEWLESQDMPLPLFLAKTVILIFLIYILYHLTGWLCAGG